MARFSLAILAVLAVGRMNADELDDAAAAALWSIQRDHFEHMGALYADPTTGRIQQTTTVSDRKTGETDGRVEIPKGSLRGIFHNHPDRARDAHRFSPEDVRQAHKLGVPSYISNGYHIYRYDPTPENERRQMPGRLEPGVPVLALIPAK